MQLLMERFPHTLSRVLLLGIDCLKFLSKSAEIGPMREISQNADDIRLAIHQVVLLAAYDALIGQLKIFAPLHFPQPGTKKTGSILQLYSPSPAPLLPPLISSSVMPSGTTWAFSSRMVSLSSF